MHEGIVDHRGQNEQRASADPVQARPERGLQDERQHEQRGKQPAHGPPPLRRRPEDEELLQAVEARARPDHDLLHEPHRVGAERDDLPHIEPQGLAPAGWLPTGAVSA